MARFRNFDDLVLWVAAHTHEHTNALMARQCLRALPALNDLFRAAEKSSIRRNLALQVLRCTLVMTANARAPKLERYLLADAKSGLDVALRVSRRVEANQTATKFFEAVEAVQFQRSPSDVAEILTNLARASGDEQAILHLEADANRIERGNPSRLFQYKLWNSAPMYSQGLLFDLGQDLLNLMTVERNRWGNWAKWLDAKFEGSEPFGLTLQQGVQFETNIANLPERKWEAGPESIDESFKKISDNLLFEEQQMEGKAGSARSLIVRYLENIDTVATNTQISNFLYETGSAIDRASLNWALTKLVGERRIHRIKRGQYSSNQYARDHLSPPISDFIDQKTEPQKSIAVQFDYDDDGKLQSTPLLA